jgi:hypothetical protein
MPTPQSIPPDIPADDLPLSFYEHSHVRKLVDMEFEMSLWNFVHQSQVELSAEDERKLQEEVVPATLEALLEDPACIERNGSMMLPSIYGQHRMHMQVRMRLESAWERLEHHRAETETVTAQAQVWEWKQA